MGLFANIKGQKAYAQHGKGNFDEALKLYEEAFNEGMDNPRNLLAYSSLLIRTYQFQKARDLLVKIQKNPGMVPEQKVQLFCNYAACTFKLGEIDKGIAILERQHAKSPAGMVYQTLGCLYVEKCAVKPAEDEPVEAAVPTEAPEATEDTENMEAIPAEPVLTPMQQWEKNVEKATAFMQEALEYDDEDSIVLDNMAQFQYRVLGNKEEARKYFDKALAEKENQIDTLWFLSRYDLEEGNTQKAIERLKLCLQGRFSPLNYTNEQMVRDELKRLGAPEDDD